MNSSREAIKPRRDKEFHFSLPRVMMVLSASQSCAADLNKSLQVWFADQKSNGLMTLEHIGSGRLLLKGFAKLIEQARVLDGDDGLRCEVFDQLNLFVGERTDLLAINGNGANEFRLP